MAGGSIVYQLEGQVPVLLKQDDAFYEPAQARGERFDNASEKDGAAFIAFYLLGEDKTELVTIL